MPVLIAIAVKSLLVAGLTLGLLFAMRKRCAAERSWVAHIGLLCLVVMAFAPLALPRWNVELPAAAQLTVDSPVPARAVSAPSLPASPVTTSQIRRTRTEVAPAPLSRWPQINATAAVTAVYAIPALILLIITALALARLVALQARAEVLVDGHWLSALARAQRRMGFKHGTALLTSNELASPISWGLMRPVILLNDRAVQAAGEAEAIIAHELAHVARLDWIKLLLARVATALFWFNPLVWMLAREAHQLREEAADDTVLAADIADTDYAQLLVGVARHECPGLLLGAHGVAPSKSSLKRRIARVLDVQSARGPVAHRFALVVFGGALFLTAPLAALTPVRPAAANSPTIAQSASTAAEEAIDAAAEARVSADLGHIIARGVSTSVRAAAAAMAQPAQQKKVLNKAVYAESAPTPAPDEAVVTRAADGATVTLYPPDSKGRGKIVARAANGATAVSYYDGDRRIRRAGQWDTDEGVHDAIEMNALGVTAEYIAAMRAASASLRKLDDKSFKQLKVVGATPSYVQALARAGYPRLEAHDIVDAAAMGLDPDYVRSVVKLGFPRPSLSQLKGLQAMRITIGDIKRARRQYGANVTLDDIHRLKAVGVLDGHTSPPDPPDPPDRDE